MKNFAFIIIKWNDYGNDPGMQDFEIFGCSPRSLKNHFSEPIKSNQSRRIGKFCVYYHKVAKLPKLPWHARFRNFREQPRKFTKHFSDQIKSYQSRRIEKFCGYYHQVEKLPKCPPVCEISGFSGTTPDVYKNISQTK